MGWVSSRACARVRVGVVVWLFLASFAFAQDATPKPCKHRLLNLSVDPHVRIDQHGRTYVTINDPAQPGLKVLDWVGRFAQRPFGLHFLAQTYDTLRNDGHPEQNVFERLIRTFKIDLRISEESLNRIPVGAPLVVVANHPRSGIDSFSVAAAIARRRPDVKLMFGQVWEHIPEFQESAIFANPFDSDAARRNRLRAFLESQRHVKGGGSVVLHPAGGISYRAVKGGPLQDPAWHEGAARMATKAKAWVLPVFVDGEPTEWYQRLRRSGTGLQFFRLLWEMHAQRGQTVRLAMGNPFPPEYFADGRSSEEYTKEIRAAVYEAGEELRGESGD